MTSMQPNIHKRLCYIQNEIMECDIKKTGYNKFKGYNYYELKDLLPPILQLCKKYDCNIYFIFIDEYGILKFFTNDGKQEINTRIKLPELEPIAKGTNLIQSAGAYQTYAKKYLLMNLFCISEVDVIDSGIFAEEKKSDKPEKRESSKTKSAKESPKADSSSPNGQVLGWDKLIEYTRNKNPNVEEFDRDILNKSRFLMAKKGLLDREENEAIYNYLQNIK